MMFSSFPTTLSKPKIINSVFGSLVPAEHHVIRRHPENTSLDGVLDMLWGYKIPGAWMYRDIYSVNTV